MSREGSCIPKCSCSPLGKSAHARTQISVDTNAHSEQGFQDARGYTVELDPRVQGSKGAGE